MSQLSFSVKSAPAFGALAVAHVLAAARRSAPASSSLDLQTVFSATQERDAVLVHKGTEIVGTNSIIRALSTLYPSAGLHGNSATVSSQIDYWLDFANDQLYVTDFKKLSPSFDILDNHLTLRSFMVGYSATLADFAVWGALKSNAIFNKQLKNGKYDGQHLIRWYNFVGTLEPVKAALLALDSAKDAAKDRRDQGSMDINLPGAAEGKVVTRFPPEPSGYLHIGHAKAVLLNNYFARHYKGKLIVRFDDTNPSKEKSEFEESIKEDLALLGVKGDVVTHTSDHFAHLYNEAIRLIKMGKAYVDDTDQETMRSERFDGIESKCRNLSVEENLARFEEMKNATEFGLKCCLRAKIDMSDNNKTMRDPVIYRCNLTPHHCTGDTWKIYPTYDFACFPVDDTRVLTDRGFLFYHEISSIIAKEGAASIQFACYDRATDTIVYGPGQLVTPENKAGYLVDVTPINERAEWDDDSTPAKASTEATGLSIRVTPDHQMFAYTGSLLSENAKTSFVPERNQQPYKMQAESLLSDCACIDQACEHRRRGVRFIGAAVGGISTTAMDQETIQWLARLGLTTADRLNAFCELYGFWLGNGTAETDATANGSKQCLAFSASTPRDAAWLKQTISRTGISARNVSFDDEQIHKSTQTVLVRDSAWVEAFSAEYTKHQTQGSKNDAQWLMPWVSKSLNRDQLRLIVQGVQRACGDLVNGSPNEICTSSVQFRDELMVVLLHAGYSAHFTAKHQTKSVEKTATEWNVTWSDAVSSDGKDASISAMPMHQTVRKVDYAGQVWCVSVDHPDHLIVAQRAIAQDGTVIKASRPMVIGNCPIVDSLEGVTHALRTIEYRDRNAQYAWFLKTLNLRWVHIYDFSRINFVYTLLSKRKLTWFVEEGLVTGWDDPRFPTVRGIRRRGMTIEALNQYILSQGASQRDLMLEWDKLWATNKKVIDPISPRHVAIIKDDVVKAHIVGEKLAIHTKEVLKHKKNPDVGVKITTYSAEIYLEQEDAKNLELNEEITLMDWGNAFVKSIGVGANGKITSIDLALNLDGDVKKTKQKITWLSCAPTKADDQKLVDLKLLDYDYLITKKKLEEDDELTHHLTKTTEFVSKAFGDANLRLLKQGDIIQLERKGYYICDRAYTAPGDEVHLIFIPDGKVASMASKAAGTDAAPAPAAAASASSSAAPAKTTTLGGKTTKAAAAAAPAIVTNPATKTSGMYTVGSIYGTQAPIDVASASKMYVVQPIYGAEMEIASSAATAAPSTPAASVTTPAPAKADKKGKASSASSSSTAAAAPAEASIISKLDIVVGKILDVKRHPDADTLYVEQIDVGEPEPREVVSGLVKYMSEDQIRGQTILVLKNLKPASMRGIKSHAMVLCASNATHETVEFLVPPAGSQPGDRVYFEGHEGTPEEQLNPKKKVWETVQPQFTTRDDLVAVWNGVPFRTDKGLVTAATLAHATIK